MNHEQSLSKNHPIQTLAAVRAQYRDAGIKIRVRYRGPRRKTVRGRTSYSGQLTCLKADAKTFSVYPA